MRLSWGRIDKDRLAPGTGEPCPDLLTAGRKIDHDRFPEADRRVGIAVDQHVESLLYVPEGAEPRSGDD
jgi:hypothetical protein